MVAEIRACVNQYLFNISIYGIHRLTKRSSASKTSECSSRFESLPRHECSYFLIFFQAQMNIPIDSEVPRVNSSFVNLKIYRINLLDVLIGVVLIYRLNFLEFLIEVVMCVYSDR